MKASLNSSSLMFCDLAHLVWAGTLRLVPKHFMMA